MSIRSIAFTVYPVANMARARRFYEESLGLTPGERSGDAWCEYDVGDGTFAVTTVDMGHTPGAPGAVIGFEVEELDGFLAMLNRTGVPFVTEVMETPVCRMAVVEDPDHNHVTIHMRK